MNDLMTKSFLSYVELKKQAMGDIEEEPDIEMGQLSAADDQNLSLFFQEIAAIKADMEEITNFFLDLQDLNEDTKSTHSLKVLRGLRDRINSDMVAVLRKAKAIKSRLESLERSNVDNRSISDSFKEGTLVDRTRKTVTNGLRVKLKDVMIDFQSLRQQISKDHKEGLKRSHYNATGEQPSDELLEKMVAGGSMNRSFEGKPDLAMENQMRNEVVKEVQRSLTQLHQLLLDMTVMVETQEEKINDIEENMSSATAYISGGTNGLYYAKQMKEGRGKWAFWIALVLVVMVLFCLLAIFT